MDHHMAATPPTLRSRPSANTLERGGIATPSQLTPVMPRNPSFSDCSDMSSPISSPMPQQSPSPRTAAMSWIFTRSWWSHGVLLLLILSALISWYPVLRYYWLRQKSATARLEHAPHIHVFHEPRCVGESIELRKSSDLCSLLYKSGVALKDNVASILLVAPDEDAASASSASAAPRLAVDVFATCRLAERPADPMRLETSARLAYSPRDSQAMPCDFRLRSPSLFPSKSTRASSLIVLRSHHRWVRRPDLSAAGSHRLALCRGRRGRGRCGATRWGARRRARVVCSI